MKILFIGSFNIKDAHSISWNLTEYSCIILKDLIDSMKDKFTPYNQSSAKNLPYFYINKTLKNKALHLILEALKLTPFQVYYKFY